MRQSLFLAALMCLTPVAVKAQDAVNADPKHFKVVLENPQVRVLRFTLGPHETSATHEHLRPHVEVQLTDSKDKEIDSDGKETITQNKVGDVDWEGIVGRHRDENIGDTPIDTIIIQLKGK